MPLMTNNPKRPTLKQLRAYVEKRYVPKYGKIVRVEAEANLLGDRTAYRTFFFANGTRISFLKDMFNTYFRESAKIAKINAPIPH